MVQKGQHNTLQLAFVGLVVNLQHKGVKCACDRMVGIPNVRSYGLIVMASVRRFSYSYMKL